MIQQNCKMNNRFDRMIYARRSIFRDTDTKDKTMMKIKWMIEEQNEFRFESMLRWLAWCEVHASKRPVTRDQRSVHVSEKTHIANVNGSTVTQKKK